LEAVARWPAETLDFDDQVSSRAEMAGLALCGILCVLHEVMIARFSRATL
jgi:hypothetical protein